MNDRSVLENAFGLRWIQDDDKGRLVYGAGSGEFRTPAEAIKSLGLGCDEAALKENLDRFPPHLRIHGGYTPGTGEPVTRITLTWEPGAAEAGYTQTVEGAEEEEGISGNVDVPADGNLKDVLKGLLIPDAQDVVSQARDDGKAVTMNGVDFWIGDQHFKASAEDEA
jgi:hypothetical protein